MHRSLRLGERDAKRAADRLLHLARRRDAVRPLGDRAVESDLVDVLASVFLAHPELLRAAHADDRYVAFVRGADAGREIGDAGTFGGGDDRRPVQRAQIGRASCRERVEVWVVAGWLEKKA